MAKPSELGIDFGKGFKGSYLPIVTLIERKVVISIAAYSVRPSRIKGSELCMIQLKISGRPVMTWTGSQQLRDIFEQTTKNMSVGAPGFPIEPCIITENDDGGYSLQDADESCWSPTAEELDDLIEQGKRRGYRQYGRRNSRGVE